MAPPLPLPPIVDGPLTKLSTQVYVDNVLPNAAVTVYQDAAGTILAGTIASTNPGGIWVPLTKKLSDGQLVTARQQYTGSDPSIAALVSGTSDPSNVPVPVEPVPNPLPSPVFISGLAVCMDYIWMTALIPGATLVITIAGTTTEVVNSPVTMPTEWFQLAPGTLTAGQYLVAVQSGPGVLPSPGAPSQPIGPPPKELLKPVITEPLFACQTSIQFADMFPSADVFTQQPPIDGSTTAPAGSFWSGLWPLKQGQLTSYQALTRCQMTGPTATYTVGLPHPTIPSVTYPPCVDVRQLTVSNLIPGEILTLQRVVTPSSGTVEVTPMGAQGVSGTEIPATITVNLPKAFQLTDPAGKVSIRLQTMLCDVLSGPTDVAVGNVGAPFKASVQGPLYACSRTVNIEGAWPGSLIQVFSGSTSNPRCNPVVATTANFPIGLWTPLVAGEPIFVRQQGCGANGTSTPPVIVSKIMDPLPAPTIVTPVRPGATAIQVNGVYPGAQVYLYVDNALRSTVTSIDTSVSLPVGAPAVANNDTLQVVQVLCGEISPKQGAGGGAVVTLGHLRPAVHPSPLIRGEAVALIITATDTVTGEVIDGLPVTLAASFKGTTPVGPSVSGNTGATIDWTPTIPSGAFVLGGPAYEDAELVNFVEPPPPKIWFTDITVGSAILWGSGFADSTCNVTVDREGAVGPFHYTADITKGIRITISCTGTPGQYWVVHVTSIAGPPTMNGNCYCPPE